MTPNADTEARYGLRVTAAETLRVLAADAARDLADLNAADHYNAQGNHDSTHRPRDLASHRAVRAAAKAETVLRLVAGLITEGDRSPNGRSGTA